MEEDLYINIAHEAELDNNYTLAAINYNYALEIILSDKKYNEARIVEVISVLAWNLYRANKVDDALKFFLLILTEYDEKHYTALSYISEIYNVKGNYEKALEFAEKALLIKPEDHLVLATLGDIYFNMQNYCQALKCFEIAQKNIDSKNVFYMEFYLEVEKIIKLTQQKLDEENKCFMPEQRSTVIHEIN